MALRAEQFVVELADALQGGLEFLVIAQPLLDEGLLFGGETDLLGAPAGIADGQNPDKVAFAVGADSATGAMANAASKQGAAEDFGSGGEGGSNLVTGFEDCLFAHL
jgi:hypothetical protein